MKTLEKQIEKIFKDCYDRGLDVDTSDDYLLKRLLSLFLSYVKGLKAMKEERSAMIGIQPAQDMTDDIRNQLRQQIIKELEESI